MRQDDSKYCQNLRIHDQKFQWHYKKVLFVKKSSGQNNEKIQNQIIMKSSSQQVIKEVIKKLSDLQKSLNSSSEYSNGSQLNAFDLIPIEYTGMIEDYLFRQNDQIYDVLKQKTDEDIEGLTYREIKSDMAKNAYYDKVRLNIPKYYFLKTSDRQKHFKLEGQLYLQKLGVKSHQLQSIEQPQSSNKDKSQQNSREATPMKLKRISKKQNKNVKKQLKKHNNKDKQNPQSVKQEDLQAGRKPIEQEIFATPQKKKIQKSKVKFSQFQYVKDFSQYKTPKNLLGIKESIQPLRQMEPLKKQE